MGWRRLVLPQTLEFPTNRPKKFPCPIRPIAIGHVHAYLGVISSKGCVQYGPTYCRCRGKAWRRSRAVKNGRWEFPIERQSQCGVCRLLFFSGNAFVDCIG